MRKHLSGCHIAIGGKRRTHVQYAYDPQPEGTRRRRLVEQELTHRQRPKCEVKMMSASLASNAATKNTSSPEPLHPLPVDLVSRPRSVPLFCHLAVCNSKGPSKGHLPPNAGELSHQIPSASPLGGVEFYAVATWQLATQQGVFRDS